MVLDFTSGSEEGYRLREVQQKREHSEWLEKIRRIWGLPLEEKVVVYLKPDGLALRGILQIDSLPPLLERQQPLWLSIGGARFSHLMIESCLVET